MSSPDQVTPPLPQPLEFSEPAPRTSDWRGAFASLAIGLGSGLFGLLPWILTGMRLPLQNLWAVGVLPDEMPVAWLPFSQYSVTYVLGLLVVGSAVAGIAARALRDRLPRAAPASIAAGLLFVQIVATAQALTVVGAGLRGGSEASVYLGSCVAVAVLGIGGGLLGFALVARGPRPGAVIALTFAAIASGWWISGFLASFGPQSSLPSALAPVVAWIPPVLVGAAIAWGGIRTAGRIVAAVVSLLLLWLVPALVTGVQSAVGSRALLRSPLDLIDYGWAVFTAAATMPELVLPRLVVAIVVAAAGIGAGELLRRRRGSAIE